MGVGASSHSIPREKLREPMGSMGVSMDARGFLRVPAVSRGGSHEISRQFPSWDLPLVVPREFRWQTPLDITHVLTRAPVG